MADYCEHGYAPQRGGDGDGSNGSCAVCEGLAELQAQLTQAQAEIAALREALAVAEKLKVWVAPSEHGMRAQDDFDAAMAKLKEPDAK